MLAYSIVRADIFGINLSLLRVFLVLYQQPAETAQNTDSKDKSAQLRCPVTHFLAVGLWTGFGLSQFFSFHIYKVLS